MRRVIPGLCLAAAILMAGCLAAGCGSSGPIASFSPSRSVTLAPTRTASLAPSVSSAPAPSASATATVQPSVTPGTGAPSTGAPGTGTAPSGGSSSDLVWLWVLLGAVVLIGGLVWIARSRARSSAAAAGWRSAVIDAHSKGLALQDEMSIAEAPGALTANDAAARWFDIQRRADDLAQALQAMREAAPDEDSRARVAEVLASLQGVRSAMDAERAPGGAGPRSAEVTRGRLLAFESSLRALRATVEQQLR